MKLRTSLKRLALAAAIAGSLSGTVANAATWNVAGNGNWNTAGSWTGGVPNAVDAVASFTNNITSTAVVTLNVSATVGAVVFGDNNNTHAYQITPSGGNTLTFDVGIGTALINKTVSTQTRQDIISANVTLADNLVVNNDATSGNGRITLSGAISESGGLKTIQKTGAGRLELLSTTSTFTGGVNVTGGIVTLGTTVATSSDFANSRGPLGTGAVTLNGSQLIFTSAAALTSTIENAVTLNVPAITFTNSLTTNGITTLSGAITGAAGAGFNKSGSGTLILTNTNTYTGATNITSGILALNKRVSLYNGGLAATWSDTNIIVSTGATAAFSLGGVGEFTDADISTLISLGNLTGGFLAGSNIAVDTTSGNTAINTILGANNNAITFNKSGTNTLTLTAANTFNGSTAVVGGALNLSNQLALQSSTLTTGGVVFDQSVGANAFTLGGLSGSGALSLQNNAGSPVAIALTLGGNNATTTHTGLISDGGSITKVGTGRTTLSNAGSTFSGGVTITGGELHAGGLSTTGIGPVTSGPFGTGTITIDGGAFIPSSSGTNTIANDLTLNAVSTNHIDVGGSSTLSGNSSGPGGFSKGSSGTLTLTGVSNYAGQTLINGGTLVFGKSQSFYNNLPISNSTNFLSLVTVDAGATMVLPVGGAGFGEFTLSDFEAVATFGNATQGLLDGSTIGLDTTNSGDVALSVPFTDNNGGLNKIGLRKVGTSTLTLPFANTHSGATTVVGGVLNLSNELAVQNSTLTVTSPGSVVFDASVVSNAFTLGGLAGNATIAFNNNVNLPITLTVGSNNADTAYTGNFTSTVNGSTLIKVGTGALTLSNANNVYDGGTFLNSGTLNINGAKAIGLGPLTIAAGTTINNTTNGNLINTNNNVQTWNGNFTFGGSRALDLGTGAVTLGADVHLSLPALGQPTLSSSNTALTVGGVISDAASNRSLTVSGIGRIFLKNQNTFTGGLIVNGGVVHGNEQSSNFGALSSPFGFGQITLGNGQIITTSVDANSSTIENNVLLVGSAPDSTITTNGTTTWTGIISGTSGFSKSGNGALILTAANTFSGPMLLHDDEVTGSLRLSNELALQNSTLDIISPTALVFDQSVGTNAFTLGGLAGHGAAILPTPVAEASIALQNNAAAAITLSIGNNNSDTAYYGALTGLGSLVKIGTGTLVLNGAGSYAGTTTVNTGMLQFGKQVSLYNNTPASWTDTNITVASGATAAFNVGGTGEFTSTDIDTIKVLGTGSGGFKDGSNIGFDTTNAGGTFTYANPITNTNTGANKLGLVKLGAGTLDLTAANTYTGNTTVNGGTLNLSGTSNVGSTTAATLVANSTLSLAAGGVMTAGTLNSTGAGAIVNNGNITVHTSGTLVNGITGTGNLTVGQSGTQATLNSKGIRQGRMTISNGVDDQNQTKVTLSQNGGNSGLLVLGNTATVNASPALTIGNNAVLDVYDNDAIIYYEAGNVGSTLINAKTAFYNWYLALDPNGPQIQSQGLIDQFNNDPNHPTTLVIIDNGQLQFPEWGGETLPSIDQVLIKYTYVGDCNLDGQVDSVDYQILVGSISDTVNQPYSTDYSWFFGDMDGDGFVNSVDYQQFVINLGQGIGNPLGGSGLGGGSPIPEPSTWLLGTLAVAGIGAAGLRRRCSK